MKFSIALNMTRFDASQPMRDVIENTLELVKLADQGGFEIVWAAEHHCIEMVIAPNPFIQLTQWAEHTSRIRLGTAVVVAPYWHPLRLAGEAALADLYSDGRLELGLARGAFQYEFDRMKAGLKQEHAGEYLWEMLPALRGVWAGDYEHQGECWSFPKATAVPKPMQRPHPPLWTAARGPETFEWALANGLDIMSTPLQKPFSEVEDLARKLNDALDNNPDATRPRWLILRSTCVYDEPEDWRVPTDAAMYYSAQFQGLFRTDGAVVNGFPKRVDLGGDEHPGDYAPETLWESLVFGTPGEVVEKLKRYEAVGVDSFCYGSNFGLDHETARRSLELFVSDVMPHFA
jgi:alkanesulfonate monooxygenase SsuD/methylene tetrahydromethanopterin reductase-like flavin-dependent oxidoreductase (luciferase family)